MAQAVEKRPFDPLAYIKRWLPAAQVAVVGFLMIIVVVILIHNLFTPPEHDIPKDTVLSLIKLFPAALAQVREWPNESNTSLTP